jgi:AAA+ ATPase superfamily predicted ATPase
MSPSWTHGYTKVEGRGSHEARRKRKVMSAGLQTMQPVKTGAAASAAAHVSSPYVGLVPFSERDSAFFFGRGEESRNIAANLRAARLTLLYGPSGVGKSSVLRAGVVAPLLAIAQHDVMERGAPDFAIVFFNEWTTEPLDALSKRIRASVQKALGQATIDRLPPTLTLLQVIKTWTERYGIELLIILDQFEEYFLYHADESGPGTFAHEFPQAVNHTNLRARFLISMRDDTLSKLDRFKGSIPMLFDNRLQIDHLDLASAYEAIVEPVKKYNELRAKDNPFSFDREFGHKERAGLLANALDELQPFLLNKVLSEVQVGKLSIGVTGQGVVKKDEEAIGAGGAPPKILIEAPYLQLVMTHIWHHEETVRSRVLKGATLEKLGGSEKIVEQHLDKIMEGLSEEEQDTAAAVFYYLVTPSGTKIAHTVKNLAEYTKLPEERIAQLLKSFLKVREGMEEYRILRSVNQKLGKEPIEAYEVYHDALAKAVLAWSAKHKSELDKKKALEVEFKKQRRIIFWGSAILIVAALASGFAFSIQRNYLLKEEVLRKEAEAERMQARANEEILISQQKSLESNKEMLQSLVYLAGGTPEEKAEAVQVLKKKIDANELDSQLVPSITQILEQVAKEEGESQTGQEAEAAVTQITEQALDTRISPRVYIQIQNDEQLDLAVHLQKRLNESPLSDIPDVRPRIIAPGIDKVGPRKNIEFSELRYFHRTDLERRIGEQLVQILIGAGLTDVQLKPVGGYEDNPNIRPNHFELWLSPDMR